MRRRVLTAVVVIGLGLGPAGCGGGEKREERAAAADPVVRALREGGLTLVVRHAKAEGELGRPERLGSCATQRMLTQAGREQARQVGAGVRRLRVPIGEVRASPLCRARDTARLAFGRATIDRSLVSPGVVGTEADDRRRMKALRALAARPPDAGENRVLVTHIGNIGGAFDATTMQEGETLVLGAGARVVGRVKAEDWAGLPGGG
ncbi:MAG TPA: histidine phosphatase family protein [Solirubrobacteraceae bacterium]|jgi:phosphohistidine phosphatase SixA